VELLEIQAVKLVNVRAFAIGEGELERRYFTASGSVADLPAVIELLRHEFFSFAFSPARLGAELQSEFRGIEDCNSRLLCWSVPFSTPGSVTATISIPWPIRFRIHLDFPQIDHALL
jgi:hypothetical protein